MNQITFFYKEFPAKQIACLFSIVLMLFLTPTPAQKVKKTPKQISLIASTTPINFAINTENAKPDQTTDIEIIGEFVSIPAGEFIMGESRKIKFEKKCCDDDKRNFNNNERPAHKVVISQVFEMGKYEVTQKQWETVMGNNPSYFKGSGRLPIEFVSWEEVQHFISVLNSRSNIYIYRLPTEAEWEYAARAGSSGDYAGYLEEMAWYGKNSGNKTHVVGTKQPNAWGLYDMYGNVYEWCSDWYGNYSSAVETDPGGIESGSDRVYRGGSCYRTNVFCRSATRYSGAPFYRNFCLGFRLVRNIK